MVIRRKETWLSDNREQLDIKWNDKIPPADNQPMDDKQEFWKEWHRAGSWAMEELENIHNATWNAFILSRDRMLEKMRERERGEREMALADFYEAKEGICNYTDEGWDCSSDPEADGS